MLIWFIVDFFCLLGAGSDFILEADYVGDGLLGLPLSVLVYHGF